MCMNYERKDRVGSQEPRVIEQSIVKLDGQEFTYTKYSPGIPEGAGVLFPNKADGHKFAQTQHPRLKR